MKKFFTILSLITIMCMLLISCNDLNDVDTNEDQNSSSNINSNSTDTRNTFIQNDDKNLDNQDILDTLVQNDDKDSDNQDVLDTLVPDDDKDLDNQDILDTLVPDDDENLDNQDILDTLVPNDEEFPFDNIVIERSGYDIVAAGKYYGNDFDNIKYYGSYYRIIDNYEDFSELTQWGNQLDETIFDENFVLVLYSYKNHYIYNSVRSQKGTYKSLKIETDLNELSIIEEWIRSSRIEIVDGERVPSTYYEDEILFPIEVQETIYLLIPKNEVHSDLSVSGKINLKTQIIDLE